MICIPIMNDTQRLRSNLIGEIKLVNTFNTYLDLMSKFLYWIFLISLIKISIYGKNYFSKPIYTSLILLFQITYNTQKAALGDVLMMKLVSYYEDKYKLTHLEPTTTESITFMDAFTNKVNKYNIDIVDKVEMVDSRHQHSSAAMEANRRMDAHMRAV